MKWKDKSQSNIIKGSIVVIAITIIVNITLIAFGVWVVIKVLQHFGIA